MGESVSLPPTPPPARLVDKSNSLMESDELKRRAKIKTTTKTVNFKRVPKKNSGPADNVGSYCPVRRQQQAGQGRGTGLTLCGDVKATDLCSVGQPGKHTQINPIDLIRCPAFSRYKQ